MVLRPQALASFNQANMQCDTHPAYLSDIVDDPEYFYRSGTAG